MSSDTTEIFTPKGFKSVKEFLVLNPLSVIKINNQNISKFKATPHIDCKNDPTIHIKIDNKEGKCVINRLNKALYPVGNTGVYAMLRKYPDENHKFYELYLKNGNIRNFKFFTKPLKYIYVYFKRYWEKS